MDAIGGHHQPRGTQYEIEQLQVSSTTHKDEFSASAGYHIERSSLPKPLGGIERERRVPYDAFRA